MGGKKDMKILRKYLAISIIVILIGVSAVQGFGNISPKTGQSKEETKIKIADIYTKFEPSGGCAGVNVTCYDYNVTWTADSNGTIFGKLLYINWSWEILKKPIYIPRFAFYFMSVTDVEMNEWIPWVKPLFFVEWRHLWEYGSGSFSKDIEISFNSDGRENILLDVYVFVRGIPKDLDDNTTFKDSCTSRINVTVTY